MDTKHPPKTFRLGIAMAGAVSAGAYTAGVIDYLLETLERWEQAKRQNRELGPDHPEYDPSVPMHDVIIDVIGGASAGGMTAAITTIALHEGVDAEEWDLNKKKLYDTWVNLNDDEESGSTLKQMLGLADIMDEEQVPALLNSRPIDAIAQRAINLGERKPLPPYISPDLEVILTITSLRGIPLEVNFFDKNPHNDSIEKLVNQQKLPAHRMYIHKGTAHFRLENKQEETPAYMVPFDPERLAHRDLMMQCAMATGAFPIGLKARLLEHIPPNYVKAMVYRMFNLETDESGTSVPGLHIDIDRHDFDFVAVDGGTINNEPFGEIIRSLEEKYGTSEEMEEDYAIIMIDPFPNFDVGEQDAEYDHPNNILELIPSVLSAIRGQAMVKEREIIRGLSSDHSRKMIFPKRENDPYPIACGSLDGFGGFFCKEFREYDYHLGRKNCQSFLRKHLCMLVDEAKDSELFQDWERDGSDARHNRFFIPKKGPEGAYPIIPDLTVESMPKDLFYEQKLKEPEKPKLDPLEIFALEDLMKKRLTTVLRYIFRTDQKSAKPYEEAVMKKVQIILRSKYGNGKSWFPGFLPWVYKKFVAPRVAGTLTKKIIGEILLDFEKRGLLK